MRRGATSRAVLLRAQQRGPRGRRTWTAAVAALWLAPASHAPSGAAPPEVPASDGRRTTAGASPVLGNWAVVGYQEPGVAAVAAGAAARWVGQTARYTRASARFATDRCATPAYVARRLTGEEFAAAYHVSPARLGIGATPVRVWEVRCRGHAWTAPGAQLIEQRPGRLLTPWDGAFYTLARRPAADTGVALREAARIRGTATFRERIALPADAVFEATLEERVARRRAGSRARARPPRPAGAAAVPVRDPVRHGGGRRAPPLCRPGADHRR